MTKPKTNRASDKNKPLLMDYCRTPRYAFDPLKRFIPRSSVVWESACGDMKDMSSFLPGALQDHVAHVHTWDILSEYNYFDWEPIQYDIQITNPPYSCKYDWIERAIALGKPFALLVPVETLGAARFQTMAKHLIENDLPALSFMLLSSRVDFFMPNKGYQSTAQFPTMWLAWKLFPEEVMYGEISLEEKRKVREDWKRSQEQASQKDSHEHVYIHDIIRIPC